VTYQSKKDGFQGQRAIIMPTPILESLCHSHPVVRQLYVTDIGYYPNARYHHRQRLHGSRQHILIYCMGGKGSVTIGPQSYTVSTGDICLLPANVSHEYKADEAHPWTIYWVHFQGANSKHFTEMMMQKMGGPVRSVSFRQTRLQLFEEIYSNLEKGYSIDNICYANTALHYFLSSCCFESNYNNLVRSERKDNIDTCIGYMQENIDKTLTLADISAAVNLSPAHIATVFKTKTGFSLIEYFNQLKIQKACQYLLFTDLRVNEIGSRLGIDDPYYFSRLFTKVLGVSPAKYRAKRRD
jgi:AraC-like DNA-binding protein